MIGSDGSFLDTGKSDSCVRFSHRVVLFLSFQNLEIQHYNKIIINTYSSPIINGKWLARGSTTKWGCFDIFSREFSVKKAKFKMSMLWCF